MTGTRPPSRYIPRQLFIYINLAIKTQVAEVWSDEGGLGLEKPFYVIGYLRQHM